MSNYLMKGTSICYISYRGIRMPLTKITMKRMTELLKDKVTAFPQCFDARGRIWPVPAKDLKITKE